MLQAQTLPSSSSISHVLLVDKAQGMSSHDVVRLLRRALHLRSIGHAGTLDPMATGLLVMGIGQGTKLLPYLMAQVKAYTATVRLGVETDTLDAEGTIIRTAPVPSLSEADVKAATRGFLGKISQTSPVFSAIKQDGIALYKRARRGEHVEAPSRQVDVFEVQARYVDAVTLEFQLVVGKGFYVRSFARDIAHALGTCGHLIQLRRLESGGFSVDRSVKTALIERMIAGDVNAAQEVHARLLTLVEACRDWPTLELTHEGYQAVRHGKVLMTSAFEHTCWETIPAGEPLALISSTYGLAAIGVRNGDVIRVQRGFNPE